MKKLPPTTLFIGNVEMLKNILLKYCNQALNIFMIEDEELTLLNFVLQYLDETLMAEFLDELGYDSSQLEIQVMTDLIFYILKYSWVKNNSVYSKLKVDLQTLSSFNDEQLRVIFPSLKGYNKAEFLFYALTGKIIYSEKMLYITYPNLSRQQLWQIYFYGISVYEHTINLYYAPYKYYSTLAINNINNDIYEILSELNSDNFEDLQLQYGITIPNDIRCYDLQIDYFISQIRNNNQNL